MQPSLRPARTEAKLAMTALALEITECTKCMIDNLYHKSFESNECDEPLPSTAMVYVFTLMTLYLKK